MSRFSAARLLGAAMSLGDTLGWAAYGGGIDWQHSGRKNLAKRRERRRVRNRIASESRKRNRP